MSEIYSKQMKFFDEKFDIVQKRNKKITEINTLRKP